MKSLINNIIKPKQNETSAELVDSHLVLSLLDAQEPKIWRMALDKIGTASFEIKKSKNSEETKLVLKPKKGTAEIIATYDTQAHAMNALTNASYALQGKKQNKTQNRYSDQDAALVTPPQSINANKQGSKWSILLLAVIVVIGLYIYLTSMMPSIEPVINPLTSTNTSLENQTGVPLSADDFLSGM